MGKFYDGIMGLVVGDALGVPFEFKKRDTFTASDMVGYGTYYQPAGTWSDDSSMTLATVESLARLGRIDLNDIMRNFYNWLRFGEFTPYGHAFDVGNTTKSAIYRYEFGEDPASCGGKTIMDNGNGSLMRILPLAFTTCNSKEIRNASALTHAHDISKQACDIYIYLARDLIVGLDKETAVKILAAAGLPKSFERIEYISKLSRDEIKSTGYVIDTLEAALWCFLNTDNYRDCVLTAVNLGEDTDTIAAVVGGLAGIYYGVGGEKGIPEEWIEMIARNDYIKGLCDAFENEYGLNGVQS